MSLWAAKTGLITQMGNQIHSNLEYRLGRAFCCRTAPSARSRRCTASWNPNGRLPAGVYKDRPPHEQGNLAARKCELGPVGWSVTDEGRSFEAAYHPFVWRDWQGLRKRRAGRFSAATYSTRFFTALGTAPAHHRARPSTRERTAKSGPARRR